MCRGVILAILLTGVGCAPQRMVYTDDEVPLADPLAAAEVGSGLEANDPPGRVVRLNQTVGGVSRQPAGMDDWAPARPNQPLGTGDSLWVPADGRAELHAGATGLRLASGSDLQVLRLENRAVQLGLARGSLGVRILPGREADSVEVDTPTGVVLCAHPGSYRVDADPDAGSGQVTVRAGEAEVTAEGLTVPVASGSTLKLTGGDAPRYDVVPAPTADGFDQWCLARDAREDRSESANYTGRSLMGYEDLDGQGTWQVTPEYGSAWAPRVPPGWAPYRNGQWAWVEPWGWTWVDDAPWGFATSHYGRWANVGGRWLWLPWANGMRQAAPMYAPALVAFAGGPGFRGPAPKGGAVAWFPLGPREPYLPAYPASPGYVRSLNVSSLPAGTLPTLAPATHANQSVPGAMTVVPQPVFTGARPVAAAALAVKTPGAAGWKLGSAPALAPQRESALAVPAGTPAAARPPAADQTRPLLTRRPPVAPVPFPARQKALAEGRGRPLAAPALAGLRAQGPPARSIPTRNATVANPGRPLTPARPGLTGRPVSGGNGFNGQPGRPAPGTLPGRPAPGTLPGRPTSGAMPRAGRGLPQGGAARNAVPEAGPGQAAAPGQRRPGARAGAPGPGSGPARPVRAAAGARGEGRGGGAGARRPGEGSR